MYATLPVYIVDVPFTDHSLSVEKVSAGYITICISYGLLHL